MSQRFFSQLVSSVVAGIAQRSAKIARSRASSPALPCEPLEGRLLLSAIAKTDALKIMPLGDSITAGYNPSPTGGYRAPLGTLLANDGYSVTYVGSQTTFNPSGSNNLNHEGHSGWKIADIDGLVKGSGNVLSTYHPDVVLLMIGTNDMIGSNQNASSDYRTLLDDIFTALPNVRVVVSPILYSSQFGGFYADQFNLGTAITVGSNTVGRASDGVAGLVTFYQRQGRAISFVSTMPSAGVTEYDGIHPTTGGYNTMANVWFGAIQSLTAGEILNQAPVAPTGVVAMSQTGSSMLVSWTNNAANATGFAVDYSTDPNFSSGVSTVSVGGSVDQATITGLSANTTYYTRVRATNSTGASANSLATSTSTLSAGQQTPSGSSPFVDNLTDFSLLDLAHTSNGVSQDATNSQLFAGDAGRAAKTTTGPQSLTWNVSNANAFSASVFFDSRVSSISSAVTLYSSADGAVWSPVTASFSTAVPTGGGWSSTTMSSASALSSGTQYVRLTIGATAFNYDVEIGSASIAYGTASAPAAPSALTATASSSSQITLSWTDNSNNETGFKVERSLDQSAWTLLTTTAANATSYSDTGLSSSTTYYYRVRATNASGDSANSNTASATTAAASVPAAPSALTATAGSSSQITLTWTDNANNETGFKVERSLDQSTWTLLTTTAANVTSYSDSGLSASTTYYYRVRASNASGDSANSNSAGATTSASSTAVDDLLNNLSLTDAARGSSGWTIDASNPYYFAGDSSRAARTANVSSSLVWDVSNASSFSAKVYNAGAFTATSVVSFYASADGTNWTAVTASTSSSSSGGSWTLTTFTASLPAGTNYIKFQIAPTYYNWDVQIGEMNVAGSTAPAAPTNLSATANSSSQISLSWTDNSNNETGFKVERSLDQSTWTLLTTTAANATSYSDSGLSASTTYYYRVRATNASGDSANSNTASATTAASTTVLDDLLNNLSLTDSARSSSGWAIDTSNPSYFAGDSSRATRSANVTSWLVWDVSNASSFSAKVYNTGAFSAASVVGFYASADGTNWTAVTTSTSSSSSGGSWTLTTFTASLPAGTNYVKFQITPTYFNWDVQIGEMSIYQ